MNTFAAKSVVENFGGWVDNLAVLTNASLQGEKSIRWYNSQLPHPMYSYGYSLSGEVNDQLTQCIKSFVESKTPFYFCNGIQQDDKKSAALITTLGADSFGNLDGMFFDFEKDLPEVDLAIDMKIKEVMSEADYMEFAEAIGLASEQPLEIGKEFFSDFSKLKNSPFRLLTAYVNDKPVGCSMLYTPKGEIAGNYYDWVIPQFRKKGINSAMVLARLKLAKEIGYKYLIAQCMGTSTRLYAGLNFEKVCELDFYGKASY